ncbi:MAG: hypothetical protein ABJA78_05225 [Ferruginibacter sp.]
MPKTAKKSTTTKVVKKPRKEIILKTDKSFDELIGMLANTSKNTAGKK